MKMEIIEGNKLLAEFMGDKPMPHPYDYEVNCFYHCKWDWLMPVVEKISNIYNQADQDDANAMVDLEILKLRLCAPSIKYVYHCVLEFIQWYNSINHQTP